MVTFTESYYYKIPQLVEQADQVGGAVYAVDVLTVVLRALGIQEFQNASMYALQRLCTYSRVLIDSQDSNDTR